MRNILIAIGLVFSILTMTFCVANKGSFLVVNNAQEPISRGIVTVCGQTMEFKNLLPTKSVPGSYLVKSDSHYDISIEFQSGKKLKREIGYVTNGMDFHHEIVVTDIDITIADSKAN
jgi:hypothetical protein